MRRSVDNDIWECDHNFNALDQVTGRYMYCRGQNDILGRLELMKVNINGIMEQIRQEAQVNAGPRNA